MIIAEGLVTIAEGQNNVSGLVARETILDPKTIRTKSLSWLMGLGLDSDQISRVAEYRITPQQISFLANPETEEPVVSAIEGLAHIGELDKLNDFVERNSFSMQEKREYLLCVGEWLRRYRAMSIVNDPSFDGNYFKVERKLEDEFKKDFELQRKSLGFYLLAHGALNWAVDYPDSREVLESIAEKGRAFVPLSRSFDRIRSAIAEKRAAKQQVSVSDYELPHGEYLRAKAAVEEMSHEVGWVLEHVRPLLDVRGNQLFSSSCTSMLNRRYNGLMVNAYCKEHKTDPAALADEQRARIHERAGLACTNQYAFGLSKKFRAIFNTFCVVQSYE